MPTVTGLIPKENLQNGRSGLRDRNGNTTVVEVTGSGFAVAMDVLVIYGTIDPIPERNLQWTGKLRNENGAWRSTLRCQNPYDHGGAQGSGDADPPVGSGEKEGDDLTVTVGTSPTYIPPAGTVPIGP